MGNDHYGRRVLCKGTQELNFIAIVNRDIFAKMLRVEMTKRDNNRHREAGVAGGRVTKQPPSRSVLGARQFTFYEWGIASHSAKATSPRFAVTIRARYVVGRN